MVFKTAVHLYHKEALNMRHLSALTGVKTSKLENNACAIHMCA